MKNTHSPAEWRAVVGFPAYEISELGAVRAVDLNGHQPKARMHSKGFVRVILELDGVEKEIGVHRLVCEAFHGVPKDRRRVVHIDGDQTHNSEFNLKWGARVRTHRHKVLGLHMEPAECV